MQRNATGPVNSYLLASYLLAKEMPNLSDTVPKIQRELSSTPHLVYARRCTTTLAGDLLLFERSRGRRPTREHRLRMRRNQGASQVLSSLPPMNDRLLLRAAHHFKTFFA